MKRRKENITQVCDIDAAMKTWKGIITSGDEVMRADGFEYYGGIVFAYAHRIESRQTIVVNYFDEKAIEKLDINEIAPFLANRQAVLMYVQSLDDTFDFLVYFVCNEQKTAINWFVCIDYTVGAAILVTDKSKLESIVRKFMKIDTPFPMAPRASANLSDR